MNLILQLLLTTLTAQTSFAHVEDDFIGENFYALKNQSFQSNLAADEIHRRTQLVFKHFGVPAEADHQTYLHRLPKNTDDQFFDYLKSVLDPTGQFHRIFEASSNSLISFLDRDSKSILEYQVTRATQLRNRKNLKGLRVAIDPGHMGGDLWDRRTGKWVGDGKNKIGEGLIVLQTALLMEKKLIELGAKVLITRRTLSPVTPTKYEELNIDSYAKRELRSRSMEPWFIELLSLARDDQQLIELFRSSTTVKRIFAERSRLEYFAQRNDLDARNRAMVEFRPDITLMIHFDASINEPNVAARNKTFAYVPGGFFATEFGSGEARSNFMAHLNQGAQWQESVELGSEMVNEISKNLGVPLSRSDKNGVTVAPGVFARNLALTRLVSYSPSVFLECLHYGEHDEFYRLLNHDGGTVMIDGKEYGYSHRIARVAESLVSAMEKYFN